MMVLLDPHDSCCGLLAKGAVVTDWDAPGPVCVYVWLGCSSPEGDSSSTVILYEDLATLTVHSPLCGGV